MFELQAEMGLARAGKLLTAHGWVETPTYMPVGTRASVKGLDSHDISELNPPMILANTYHLWLRPGSKTIADLGGLHDFMRWNQPILTDSGGFQVFSQAGKVSDEGVEFSSFLDGKRLFLRPEDSIAIQQDLGSDVMMVLDDVVPDAAARARHEEAVERTTKWAVRCVESWHSRGRLSSQSHEQLLFAIVQGGTHLDLRQQSLSALAQLPVSGLALGGETVGYDPVATEQLLRDLNPLLPQSKPRYVMGHGGGPEDVIRAVRAGADLMDCVAPSRLARNGALLVGSLQGSSPETWSWESDSLNSRLSIGRAEFATDSNPIQTNCSCTTCRAGYTRAYLHHLYKWQELAYYRLATIHNLHVMLELSRKLRLHLIRGRVEE